MTPTSDHHAIATWQQAQDALLWLQVDAPGLGGVWLQAPHGPMRDVWLQGLLSTQPILHKVPTHADAMRLLGGVDLSTCLQTGAWVTHPGLLAQSAGGVVLLPMAERQATHTLALVTQGQDQHGYAMVALDESDPDEPALPARLQDRLALWLDLRSLPYLAHASEWLWLSEAEVHATRARMRNLHVSEEQRQSVVAVAAALGVDSLRALHFTLRLARVLAALEGERAIDPQHLEQAIRCVLLPRATQLPSAENVSQTSAADPAETPLTEAPHNESNAADTAANPPPATPPTAQVPEAPSQSTQEQTANNTHTPQPTALEDVLLAASVASLPPHVLEKLASGQAQRFGANTLGQRGQASLSRHRGRPMPARKGSPHNGARLHVLATMRAAVAHQAWRTRLGTARLAIRAEDFHVHRFAQKSATCLVVAMDASGSAAMERLSQAKGAVELLLNQSYARRDSVCVMAFRGTQAQTLLPPSRSLVRAKKALAHLPGGGGTPLATALQHMCLQAQALQRNGTTPLLVVLSDGRANVSLQGLGGREQAHRESLQWAQACARLGVAALWIDTGLQANGLALPIARAMHAQYLHMPHVASTALANAMQTLRPTGNAKPQVAPHVA